MRVPSLVVALMLSATRAAQITWSFSEQAVEVPADEDLTISWSGGHNVPPPPASRRPNGGPSIAVPGVGRLVR